VSDSDWEIIGEISDRELDRMVDRAHLLLALGGKLWLPLLRETRTLMAQGGEALAMNANYLTDAPTGLDVIAPSTRTRRPQTNSMRVECPKCGCFGRYPLHRLIDPARRERHDSRFARRTNRRLPICPRKRAASISDQCHARCPDLPWWFDARPPTEAASSLVKCAGQQPCTECLAGPGRWPAGCLSESRALRRPTE